MIKAGIFDVGGVLHEVVSNYIYEDICQTLGISESILKENWYELADRLGIGEITEKEFWQLFLQKIKSNKILPEESLFLRKYIEHFKAKEDVLNLVKKLKKNNYRVAVLSNTIQPHADYLNKIGFLQDFDPVVLSQEVGMLKPDVEIYKCVLKKLQVEPEEVFFVDDKLKNIEGAAKLGIHAIHFQDSKQLELELKKLGVKI